MQPDSVIKDVGFRILHVENDPNRGADFLQRFYSIADIDTVASWTEAILQLQQGLAVDLVVINDNLGGLKFLNTISDIRLEHAFSTMLLIADGVTDTNVQAVGQPLIDIFPIDFDEEALRQRLLYLIRKKEYQAGKKELSRLSDLRLPLGKRLFDIALASAILLALSPILGIVALAIRMDSDGPIFYRSKRIGMGYRLFDMFKFRTMRVGADKLITSMASQNMYQSATSAPAPDALCDQCRAAGTGCQRSLFQDNMQVCEVQVKRTRDGKAMFMKFKEDPRVTSLGKFLRNSSIDELPQLLNILRGDMSFVGNRPLPPYEAEKLTTLAYSRRFAAPAGLTGLWQVTKRGKAGVSDQERIQLDILYAKQYSLKTDLIIMIRTLKAVFQKENV